MNQTVKDKIIEFHKKYGDIRIECKGADSLPLDSILDFQGKLKKRSQANLIKLIERIFSLGFKAPFFIWDHSGDYYCFDGHGRIEALCAIREAGIEIPGLFPICWINAKDEKEARETLLSITSQYGEFDISDLDKWLENIDDEIKESLRLVDSEIKIINNFGYGTIEEQGKLDQLEPIICPKCGEIIARG